MKRYIRPHRLDNGMRGWIANTARKNIWRVPSWYDVDDLVQEGYICYCKCADRYRDVKEQRHFMALLKITFINHIHDLAKQKRRTVANSYEELLPNTASEPEGMTFHVMMKQLPAELQELVQVLLDDAWSIPMLRFPDGTRETTNAYLNRLLGIPGSNINVAAVFREHFGVR